LEAQPQVYMEAGDHETLIRMSHAQFAHLTAGARHGRFSDILPAGPNASIFSG
jgi:Ala-tRNA(Pro) deacylase